MDQNIEPQSIIKFFVEDRESTIKLRDEMNESYVGYRINVINQHRSFFRHISLISAGIIGFTPPLLKDIVFKDYFYAGLILHFFLIFIIFSWLREVIDDDSNTLQIEQDKYNTMLEAKLQILDKFIDAGNFTLKAYQIYKTELENSDAVKDIDEEVSELKRSRKNRDKNIEYNGELVLFLFSLGTAFIILSILQYEPTGIVLFFSVLLIFGLTFSTTARKLMKLISIIGRYVNKKL